MRVDSTVAKWAAADVEYPFLMENLLLRQAFNKGTQEHDIEHVLMHIRNREDNFTSDAAWINHLRSSNITEHFMSQDVHRWRNQNIAVSVYNTKHHGGGFLIEGVNVDKPWQRAFIRLPSLLGIRG